MKEYYDSSYDDGFCFKIKKENALYYSFEGRKMRNGSIGFCLNEGLFEVNYDTEVIKKMPSGEMIVLYEFESNPRGHEHIDN